MSIYVMSDLHGKYSKFMDMLDIIEFSDEDIMYVLGDVIDRGEEPVKLLREMSLRANILPVMGNHEIMALDVLKDLLVEIREDNYDTQINSDVIQKLLEWQQNGGDITLKQFKELSNEDRFFLLDYLEEFASYEIEEVNGNTFLLVHSTLGNFSKYKKLSDYNIYELAFMHADYNKKLFDDDSIYIVSGHIPTQAITGKPEIYKNCNNIDVDCGAAYGGRLACLRLDDMREFYI